MSLTSRLADKDSTLRRFMARELPNTAELLAHYRTRLPIDVEVIRPSSGEVARVAWSTLGIAIDHRLRFGMASTGLGTGVVAHAVAAIPGRYLSARGAGRNPATAIPMVVDKAGFPVDDEVVWEAAEHSLGRFGLKTARGLLRAGIALLREAEQLNRDHKPFDRNKPIVLVPDIEERLDRVCYAAAWFDEAFRSGQVWPGTPLGDADDSVTLGTLLAAVPAYSLRDMGRMVTAADEGLRDLRLETGADAVISGPEFKGSRLVGGADADWIASDMLCDVKALADPRRLEAREAWQLIGYALLDFDDRYGIERVAWYMARIGTLIAWSVSDALRLVGARQTLRELRTNLEAELSSESRTGVAQA